LGALPGAIHVGDDDDIGEFERTTDGVTERGGAGVPVTLPGLWA
jgi:hypothetical protein